VLSEKIQREGICLILNRPADLCTALHNICPWKRLFTKKHFQKGF